MTMRHLPLRALNIRQHSSFTFCESYLPFCWANVWGTVGCTHRALVRKCTCVLHRLLCWERPRTLIIARASSESPTTLIPVIEVLLVELTESKSMWSLNLSVLSLSFFKYCSAISSFVKDVSFNWLLYIPVYREKTVNYSPCTLLIDTIKVVRIVRDIIPLFWNRQADTFNLHIFARVLSLVSRQYSNLRFRYFPFQSKVRPRNAKSYRVKRKLEFERMRWQKLHTFIVVMRAVTRFIPVFIARVARVCEAAQLHVHGRARGSTSTHVLC